MIEILSNLGSLDRLITRIGGYLDLIPPLPQTSGGQDVEVLRLFDKPRKEYLSSLARVAADNAQSGFDPSQVIEVALPYIDRLFSDYDKLNLILSLAVANHEFGNDSADLLASVKSLAERRGDAEMYARLGEA